VERIYYSNGLIQSYESSLRLAFSQPTLRLTRRPPKQASDFSVEIESPQRYVASDDHSGQIPIADVLTSAVWPETFYFSFRATFALWAVTPSKPRSHILDHASLTIFQELAAGELGPCFRADWDPRAAQDAKSKHAQPHWHFVQRPDRIESIVRTLVAPSGAFAPEMGTELFSGLAELDKFHFAMTPLWDESNTQSIKTVFATKDFEKWFDRLAHYIATQLAYVCDRSRSRTASANEFVADQESVPNEVLAGTERSNNPSEEVPKQQNHGRILSDDSKTAPSPSY
jgi:hypothetical protein